MNQQFNTPMICMPLQDSQPFPYRCCPALVYCAAQNPCCSAPTILLTLPHLATQGEVPISATSAGQTPQPYLSPSPLGQYLPTPSLQASAPAPAQQQFLSPVWEPKPSLSKTIPDSSPRHSLPVYTKRPASGLKTDPANDLSNVSIKINVVPAPVQEQKPSSEPVVLVASPLKPQPLPSDLPITETHHRPASPKAQSPRLASPSRRVARRNVKPQSFISDSPFAEPPYHSSAVLPEVPPESDTFESLPEYQLTELSEKKRERQELARIAQKFLDNKNDCVMNVEAAYDVLKRVRDKGVDPKLVDEYVLHIRNALANLKLYNEAMKELQSRGYLKNAKPVALPKHLLLETDLEIELQPITAGEAADLDELFPERRKLAPNPLGPLKSYSLPSPNRVFGTSFASRNGREENEESKDAYDDNKRRYGLLKRSFDRAKEIEDALPFNNSKNTIVITDAQEKQKMLDMMKSYFDHRRNMISHYAPSE